MRNPFFAPEAIQYSTIGALSNPGAFDPGGRVGPGRRYGTKAQRMAAGKAAVLAATKWWIVRDASSMSGASITPNTHGVPAGWLSGPYATAEQAQADLDSPLVRATIGRMNPSLDDELRALERSAAMGDTVAAERLAVMQGRMHVPQYEIKCDECKTEIGRTDSMAQSAAGGLCAACRSHRGRSIRFMQHFVTDGVTKAAVTYSAGQMYGATRGDPFRLGVTLYAKTFPDGDKLKAVFAHHYRNRTDFASDLFDRGAVTFYEDDPLYPAALARAQENAARDQVRHAATHARRAARGRSNPCPYLERFESNPPHENTIAYEHLPDGMVLSTVRLGPYRVGGGGSFETAVLYPSGGTAEVHRSASEDEALATHVRVARKYNKGRVDTSRPGWVRSMMGLQPSRFNPRASAPRMFTPISMGKARRLAAEYSGVAVFVGPRGMEFRVVGEGEAERLTEALEAEIMGHYPNGQASYGPGDEPGFWSVHAWPDYANL